MILGASHAMFVRHSCQNCFADAKTKLDSQNGRLPEKLHNKYFSKQSRPKILGALPGALPGAHEFELIGRAWVPVYWAGMDSGLLSRRLMRLMRKDMAQNLQFETNIEAIKSGLDSGFEN